MTWIEYLQSKGVDPNAEMAFGNKVAEAMKGGEKDGESSGDNQQSMGNAGEASNASKGGTASSSSDSSGSTNDAQLVAAMNNLTEALTQQALDNRISALTSNPGHTETPEDRMHAFLFGKEK